MQLNKEETNLLFEVSLEERLRRSPEHSKVFNKLAQTLQTYENKNLLVIGHTSAIEPGELTPLLFFAEYESHGDFNSFSRGPDFFFKKPVLYADIKIKKQNLSSSSVRYRWLKNFGRNNSPFWGRDDFTIHVIGFRYFGLIYGNKLIFDADVHDESCYHRATGIEGKSMWDVIEKVFRKRVDDKVSYRSLYNCFENRFMTSCSYE